VQSTDVLYAAIDFTKSGPGKLVLGAHGTYDGTTDITAGTLEITDPSATANSISVKVQNGARFKVSASDAKLANVNVQPGGFLFLGAGQDTGAGATVPTAPIAGTLEVFAMIGANYSGVQMADLSTISLLIASGNYSSSLTLNGACTIDAGVNFSIGGAIGGAGGFTKTGGMNLTLGGANTYSGPTTINAGKLLCGGDNRLSANSAVTVNAGGTLDANGCSTSLDLWPDPVQSF